MADHKGLTEYSKQELSEALSRRYDLQHVEKALDVVPSKHIDQYATENLLMALWLKIEKELTQ